MTTLHVNSSRGSVKPYLWIAGLVVFVSLPVIILGIILFQGFVMGSLNPRPYNVRSVNIQNSEATIVWQTDKDTQGVVEYGTGPASMNSYAPETEARKDHSVRLTRLVSATTYYFQLNIEGKIYDNDGVPWTFTTKTKDGQDAAEAIKGITTRITPTGSSAITGSSAGAQCVGATCEEIRANLGKGCVSADYFRCLLTQSGGGTSSTPAPFATTTPRPGTPTVTPTPDAGDIKSASCAIKYLQVEPGKTCVTWSWESYATKDPGCRKAFDRYVFQCSSKSFTSTNTEDVAVWYYNNAITNMSTNSIELLNRPPQNARVYCQVRAEDAKGNTTDWVQASAVCTYPPTATPTP